MYEPTGALAEEEGGVYPACLGWRRVSPLEHLWGRPSWPPGGLSEAILAETASKNENAEAANMY